MRLPAKCWSWIRIPKLHGVQEKPMAETSHCHSPCPPSAKHGTSPPTAALQRHCGVGNTTAFCNPAVGRGIFFFPTPYPIGPPRTCMLRAKIGGVAHGRKGWVIKACSSYVSCKTISQPLKNNQHPLSLLRQRWPESLTTHLQKKNLLKSS